MLISLLITPTVLAALPLPNPAIGGGPVTTNQVNDDCASAALDDAIQKNTCAWFAGSAGTTVSLTCPSDSTSKVVYTENLNAFAVGTSQLPLETPDGHRVAEGTLAKVTAAGTCPTLWLADLTPGPTQITDPKKLLKTTLNSRASAGTIETHSATTEMADELVTILGEIVIDRASQAAFDLLEEKLNEWMSCNEDDTALSESCSVLESVRLQDIIASPDALVDALVKDGVDYAIAKIPTVPQAATEITKVVTENLSGALLEALLAGEAVDSSSSAQLLLADLQAYATAQIEKADYFKGDECAAGQAQADTVTVLAIAAQARCVALSDGTGKALEQCDTSAAVTEVAATWKTTNMCVDAEAERRARGVASDLQISMTATRDNEPDAIARIRGAFDATTDLACWYGNYTDGCPSKPSETSQYTHWISALRPLVDAALERDPYGLVAGASGVFDFVATDEGRTRAMQMIGASLTYASTYASESEDATEERKAIVESITQEMTSRTSREGDWIVSLAGSLKATGGVRTNSEGVVYHGPFALPLGLGVHYVGGAPRKDNADKKQIGFLVEASMLDLGQYVAWQLTEDTDGNPVTLAATPSVADAFSPTLSLSLTGRKPKIPFVVGVYGGYDPSYDLDTTKTSAAHAWNAGVAAGMYVPLIDFN